MAVTIDALYHYAPDMSIRAVITDGVEELTHREVAGTLAATIPGTSYPKPGDMLGFLCIDGRFRLFEITAVSYDDDAGQVSCEAVDAAIQELTQTIVPGEVQLLDVTARQAVETWLQGTGWQIGDFAAGDDTSKLRSYYQPLWEILGAVQTAYSVRVLPYYIIQDNRITGKHVDIVPDVGVYRGRLVESGYDASKISITEDNAPITAVFGLGNRLGTEETSPRLTIADAVWSHAEGDPADKPKGQDWIGDDAAAAPFGRHRQATVVFDDIADAKELLQATWDYLQTVTKPVLGASGTLYDLELIEGVSHAAIRAGDIVRMRPQHYPQDVEARVVEIRRSYTDASRTAFEIGTGTASAMAIVQTLNVNAQHTKETLTLYRNKFAYDEVLLSMHSEVISLHADRIAELITGSEEAYSIIQTLADQIMLRVEAGKVISAINMSPEQITISADRINLEGLVTAEMINAAIASAGGLYADRFTAKRADITTLYADNLFFSNQALGLYGDINVCTRSATYYSDTADISYLDWNGEKKTMTVATGITQAQSPSYRTISYLGYK